jgi:hypothetical protein
MSPSSMHMHPHKTDLGINGKIISHQAKKRARHFTDGIIRYCAQNTVFNKTMQPPSVTTHPWWQLTASAEWGWITMDHVANEYCVGGGLAFNWMLHKTHPIMVQPHKQCPVLSKLHITSSYADNAIAASQVTISTSERRVIISFCLYFTSYESLLNIHDVSVGDLLTCFRFFVSFIYDIHPWTVGRSML